jgi:hypothetical protein
VLVGWFFFFAFVLGIWKSFRLSGAGVVAKLLGEEGFSNSEKDGACYSDTIPLAQRIITCILASKAS